MSEIVQKLYAANPMFKTGEKLASGRIKTPVARASFVHVFRPQKPMEGASDPTPKYSIVLLFPAEADLTLLKTMATDVTVENWGGDKAKWPSTLRSPFRDQGEKTFAGYVAGSKYVTLSSKEKPGLVNAQGMPIDDETMFYSGCWCQVSVNAFAYPKKGAKGFGNYGVSFGLGNIQKIYDDEPLSGRPKAESEFAPVAVPAGATAAAAGAGSIFD